MVVVCCTETVRGSRGASCGTQHHACREDVVRLPWWSCAVQRQYEGRVVLRVAHSSRRTTLMCRGEGVKPCLEFSQSQINFGAAVPYFAVEEELTICNPCSFPIELYSLEFDQMHLEDEKVRYWLAVSKC